MKKLISIVNEELSKNATYKWIETYDRIYTDEELEDKLKLENQLTFWRKNCDIRRAFNEIAVELKGMEKPSKRLVGWSEIARKANCDRNTLKRSERVKWVTRERGKLLEIFNVHYQKESSIQLVKSEDTELIKSKNEVLLLKKESAKWFLNYEYTLQELERVKSTLAIQIDLNKKISIQNQKLLKEINKLN